MTPLTIRPLLASDVSSMQEIDRDAHGTAWSQRTFLDDVERTDRVHLVGEAGDETVGHAAAWIDHESCRITNVAVARDRLGQGHATALLLAVIDEALTVKRVANMQLEVRPANRRAQRLYSRFGFMPIGVERDFYDQRDIQGSRDALVMAVADVYDEAWRARLVEIKASHADQNNAGAVA